MAGLSLTIDTSGFGRLADTLHAVGKKIEPGIAGALNQVGRAGRLGMIRTLPKQTGLKVGTITRFLRETPAGPGNLVYRIKGRGGDVSLKYFAAREVAGGVTAKPWSRSTFYQGAFITSGRPGHRRPVKKLNLQVYKSTDGRWGGHITKLSSGLFLPREMVTGATAEAWQHAVAAELPGAVDAAMRKALSV